MTGISYVVGYAIEAAGALFRSTQPKPEKYESALEELQQTQMTYLEQLRTVNEQSQTMNNLYREIIVLNQQTIQVYRDQNAEIARMSTEVDQLLERAKNLSKEFKILLEPTSDQSDTEGSATSDLEDELSSLSSEESEEDLTSYLVDKLSSLRLEQPEEDLIGWPDVDTANQEEKSRGDEKLRRCFNQEDFAPKPLRGDFLRGGEGPRYPTAPLSQEIIEWWTCYPSHEKIEAFLARTPFNLAKEPSIVCALEKAGEKLVDVIESAQNKATMSMEEINTVRSMCQELKAGIKKQIEQFGQELRKDIKEGRTVITAAFAKRYPELYRLRKQEEMTADERYLWSLEFQRLVNEVYLGQELRNTQNPHRSAGTFVEQVVIKTMGLATGDEMLIRARQHEAEIEVIKLLMQGEGIDAGSLEELTHLLATKKLEARLKAVGVKDRVVTNLIKVIRNLEEGYSTMIACSEVWKGHIAGLPDEVPPLALRFLLQAKAASVDHLNSSRLKAHIQSNSDLLTNQVLGPYELLSLQIPSCLMASVKDGSLYATKDSCLLKVSKIYQDWGHRLVEEGEMIQGLDDDDAVLDLGVCLAIASRWVWNAQKYPHLTAQEFVRVSALGQITARDRFRQVYHLLGISLNATKHFVDWFPAQFLKQEKIKTVEKLFDIQCSVCDAAKEMKVAIEGCKDKLSHSNGALLLIIDGHAFYIKIDEIYLLGDPNIGILDFSESATPLDELYRCFEALLRIQHPDNTWIACLQFRT